MKTDPASLEKLVTQATGPDGKIDRAVADMFDGGIEEGVVSPYTASVDACIALIQRTLPDWHWHVGHGPMGIIPYASMTRDGDGAGSGHVEATAPTVPLALLRVLVKAVTDG